MPNRSPGAKGNNFGPSFNRPPSGIYSNGRITTNRAPQARPPGTTPAWQPPRSNQQSYTPRGLRGQRISRANLQQRLAPGGNPNLRTSAGRGGLRPSSIGLPDTTATSGVRTPMRAVDPFRTAQPSRLATRPNLGSLIPRGLPRFAGSGAVGLAGIGGLTSFAVQVAQGEDPRRAAYVSAAGTAGAILGAGIGAPIPFFGSLVGGAIGGAIGSVLGSAAFDEAFPASASPGGLQPGMIPRITPMRIPFYGGQMAVNYQVTTVGRFTRISDGQTFNLSPRITNVLGPVRGLQSRREGNNLAWYLLAASPAETQVQTTNAETNKDIISTITNINRADGLADTGGNRYEPAPTDAIRLVPGVRQHPMNTPHTRYVPSSAQRQQNGQGNAPLLVPSGRPAPRLNPPSPDIGRPLPHPTPSRNTPARQPAPQPIPGRTISGSSARQTNPLTSPTFDPRIGVIPLTPLLVRPASQPTGLRPTPTADPPPPTTGAGNPCSGNGCGGAIRQDVRNNGRAIQDIQSQLAALNAATEAASFSALMAKLDRIDNKLGSQVPGGISGLVRAVQDFAEKAWRNTRMDKLINVLTLITTLHNASMLARELGETLGELTSQALAVVGIKDEEGNALDVNSLVGGAVENFIKGIVGEEVYTGVSQTWIKANRIITSATNIVWTIRSISDGTQEVLEWIGENTGKIGNALKRWGVVGERAYPWMSERVKAQDLYRRKMGRILDGLEQAEDTASSLYMVTSEVREIQEEIGELGEQRQQFQQAVQEAIPTDRPDNAPVLAQVSATAIASESPDLTPVDTVRNENVTP